MKIVRYGNRTVIECPEDRAVVAAVLDRPFSYKVVGAEFTPSYQSHVWDGRQKLVRRAGGDKLILPGGLYQDAMALLTFALGPVEVRDDRLIWQLYSPAVGWGGHALRSYQIEAVDAAVNSDGGGLLAMPIRSGKTLTAAMITSRLQMRTCFVATSDFLVRQARDVFAACLPDHKVTTVGGGTGEDESGDVVIVSIQTIAARLKTRWLKNFGDGFPVVFFDEIHHLAGMGDAWREAAQAIDAAYRFGLSGTVNSDDEKTDLWVRAMVGPTLFRLDVSTLIEDGVLVRPQIRFVRHDAPSLADHKWSPATYSEGVVKCDARNKRLCTEAVMYAKQGLPVLVDVSRVGHGRILASILRGALRPGQVAILTGSSGDDDREKALAGLRDGSVKILVGTVFGEGVDIPELAVVVNAEGGKASVSAIQRLRCLTPSAGKTECFVVEAWDDQHPHLAEATLARLKLYRSIPAFRVSVEPKTAATPSRAAPKRTLRPAAPKPA